MNTVVTYMSDVVAPKMNKITRNVWIRSIQESIMATLPLILVGSLITLVSILNEWVSWMPNLTGINRFTFGLVALVIAFLVPFYILEHKGHRDRRLIAGATGAAVFLYLTVFSFGDDGSATVTFDRFGATGIFAGLLAGLFAGLVMSLFAKWSFFKNSTALPDFIIVWFDTVIPILVCIGTAYVLVDVANFDVFNGLVSFLSPLVSSVQSFWGFVLTYFISCFLYSFGMSAWVLFPLIYPLQLQAIEANAQAVAAGGEATYINTYETLFSGWVGIGGMGATLPLVILMLTAARSARLKAIGKASIVPSVFNINEPVVFGAPIAFNPILMIPMWINSLIPPAIVYAALSWGLVPIPSRVYQLWYTPFPISTWIVSPGLASLLLLAVVAAIVTAVWFPFLKAYDRQLIREEAAELAAEAADPTGSDPTIPMVDAQEGKATA